MTTIQLQIPDELLAAVNAVLEEKNITLNQWIQAALSEKLSTASYLERRADLSSREAFEAVLAKVPSAPPIEGDEL